MKTPLFALLLPKSEATEEVTFQSQLVANGALSTPWEGPGRSGRRKGKCVNSCGAENFLLQCGLLGLSGVVRLRLWAAPEMSSVGWTKVRPFLLGTKTPGFKAP